MHMPISGEIFKKAKFFYKLWKKNYFQASEAWLDKFKRRFGTWLLTHTGEKLLCDVATIEPYKQKLKNIIEHYWIILLVISPEKSL